MPQKKLGVIVLTNQSGDNPVAGIVTRNVYDRLLLLPEVDWVGRVREQQKKAKETEAEAKKKSVAARKEGTSPSHALSDYAGDYEHPAYGLLRIESTPSGLNATFHHMTGALAHYHYDVFDIPEDPLNPMAGLKVTFGYDVKGDIDRVLVPLEPAVKEIVFSRVPAVTKD